MINFIFPIAIVGGLALLFHFVFYFLWKSEAAKHSLELIKNNAEAQVLLGENYKRSWYIFGSIRTSPNGSGGEAHLHYKLKGKTGFATVEVLAEKANYVWMYQKIIFKKNGNNYDVIDLLNPNASVHKPELVNEGTVAREKKRKQRFGIITVLIGVAVALLIAVFIFGGFETSEPYTYSLELIQNSPEVRAYLGDNCKKSGLIEGEIKEKFKSGSADLRYTLKGKKGVLHVHVVAEKINDVWVYRKIVLYNDELSTVRIDLTPRR